MFQMCLVLELSVIKSEVSKKNYLVKIIEKSQYILSKFKKYAICCNQFH